MRWRGPGETALARGAADAGRRPSQRRALGGRLHGRRRRGARSGRSRPGSTSSPAGATSSRARSTSASPTSSGELERGRRRCSRAAADARQGRGRARLTAAAEAIAGRAIRQRARSTPALLELVEAVQRAHRGHRAAASTSRSTSTARSARFGSWYELFPRSWGGFKGVEEQVPRLAELGFDVLYMPPIHPIGHTNRKGRNNTLTRRARRPRQPVGDRRRDGRPRRRSTPSSAPLEDFARWSHGRAEHGIDIALDFAINCSPDHPWLKEHPEWFYRRPDGTLKYAENPPKKYQDIYNVNFGCRRLARRCGTRCWASSRHWVDRGVQGLPRRQPAHQAVRLLGVAHRARSAPTHPDVIFLAEAFTRRAVMRELAKIGFTPELHVLHVEELALGAREYVNELAHAEEAEYFRPNFFVNTPDILTDYLAEGGPPAFPVRLILARHAEPELRRLLGLRELRAHPAARAARSTSTTRSTRSRQRASTGRCCR